MRGVQGSIDTAGKKADHFEKSVQRVSAIDIAAVGHAFTSLAAKVNEISQPGIAFESQMKEVQAITGVTGKGLQDLGNSARQTAKIFGGDASAQMEAYKTVLSRLGPDLAQSPQAIDEMGRHIQTLSKTMGGDAVGATNALTTAMLQYQTDLTDPLAASAEMARMMNVMAAGAKEGAAEVPQISAALEQSGVQAKLAKLSFEETNAAIQAMAEGGKYGSEAGVALRNVLTTISAPSGLSKEASGILQAYGINMKAVADTSRPFAERLKMLGPLQTDLNALTAVFGKENAANAQILIRSAESQAELTQKISGTNTATEQASVIMDSHAERYKRAQAWMADLKISFFNMAGSVLPFVEHGATAVGVLADMTNARQGVLMMVDSVKKLGWAQKVTSVFTSVATSAQNLLNFALINNPVGRVVMAVTALGAGFYIAYQKSERFRAMISGVIAVGQLLTDVFIGAGKAVLGAFTMNPKLIAEGALQAAKAAETIRTKGFGGIYNEGYDASIKESKEKEKKEQEESETEKNQKKTVSALLNPPTSPNTPPATRPPALPNTSKGMELSGGGAGKAISMTLNITNHFHNISSKLDVRKIADEVAGVINDRLRDASVSL